MSEHPGKATRDDASSAAVSVDAALASAFLMVCEEFRDGDKFRDDVVRDALGANAPASARGSLNAAIRARVKIKGFRDASKAKPDQLCEPVVREIQKGNSKLAGALLRVWHSSRADLRRHVAACLDAADVEPIGLDFKNGRFTATWPIEEWRAHRKAVVRQHTEWNEDAVALMLCLVAGRAPLPELDEILEDVKSKLFASWIDQLSDLHATAPDWEEADAFANVVRRLAVKKAKTKIDSETQAVEDAINDIRDTHKEDVKYLGLDVRFWFGKVKARQDLIPEARIILNKLKRELTAYTPIRPQAASLEEEKRRAAERAEREAAILKIVEAWEAHAATPETRLAAEVGEEHAAYRKDTPVHSPRPLSDDGSELQALKKELTNLKARHEEKTNGLHLEKTQLASEISELKKQLKESGEAERYWRGEYTAEKGRRETDGEERSETVTTVKDAIDRADEAFSDKLVLALNNRSSTDKPFQKPQDVLRALTWLATEFRRLRLNPSVSPDFNRSIKRECPGWFYKPNQTSTTKGMYSDWYKTTVNGKTYDLSNHIGKGNSFDPVSTIRIAFAWDEQDERVVVGYVGPHQRNRQS